jgi:hypothetical protein
MPNSPRRTRRTQQAVPPRRFQPWRIAVTALSCILLAVVAVAVPMVNADRTIRPDEASIRRVVAAATNGESPNPDDYETIDPAHWRSIEMVVDHPNGGTCNITLLRPLPWVYAMGAKVGENVHLSMPEMGIMGPALVKSIGPCPPSKPNTAKPPPPGQKYRPVTGTFKTTNAVVLNLFVEGLSEPIGATASHPFYSVDRKRWVAAGELRPGETLRTESGTAKFVRAERKPGTETVYNLEVHKSHNFYVSKAKLLVHNDCVPDLGRKLEYLFGNATGNAHNVDRSLDMARQLNRIGIQGDAGGRALLTEHLTMTLNNPMNILRDEGSRTIRESLLGGPGGFLKMESIWEGNKLITMKLFGGG